jgi:precorrin-6B methylase 2
MPIVWSLALVSMLIQVPEVPYVATTPKVVEAMLKLARVAAGDVVYDLGCGDGRIAIMAARKYGARGVGVDIDPERIAEAERNARKAGVSGRTRFLVRDVYETDVGEASVIMLYMTADVNRALRPKLVRQLAIGSRIVAHTYDMDDWKPDKTIVVDRERLFLWVVTGKAKARFGAE